MRRLGSLVLGVALLLGVLVSAAPAEASARRSRESVLLDRPRRGRDALSRLRPSALRTAAARSGLSAAALRSRLTDDPTHGLDRTGHLFVADTDLADPSPQAAAPAAAAPFPYGQTFLLHSRPGANRTIYLDVDGQLLSGLAWNAAYNAGADLALEPYDTDGSPATFSTAEQDVIQSIWQRVAEDYSMFDIDVTTEDPGDAAITRSGSSDQQYGTRAVVTNNQLIATACGCGGVAYVGTFDSTGSHAYYQPALALQKGVGSSAKSLAEVVSHEVGHNLGLSHDGTATSGYYSGQGLWAPIMGTGYSKPLTQWSRGEYAGANQTQDDLAVMQANGAVLRNDDHGDTAASATRLSGPTVSASGRITTRADTDWFSFRTTGGAVSISAAPAGTSPDLDLELRLVDATGATLATAEPTAAYVARDTASGLGATLDLTVGAGTYSVVVDGVGSGDPLGTGYSDYGSLGTYDLAGVLPAAPPVVQPPTAPSAVSVFAIGAIVGVRWTGISDEATGVTVLRQKLSSAGEWGPPAAVASLGAEATNLKNKPGRGTFRYLVVATNAGGSSPPATSAAVRI